MSNRELFLSCIELLRKAADAPQQLSALRSFLDSAADDIIRAKLTDGIAALEQVAVLNDRVAEAIAILEGSKPASESLNEVKGLLFELSDFYLDGSTLNRDEQMLCHIFGPKRDTMAGYLYEVAGDLDKLLHPEEYESL